MNMSNDLPSLETERFLLRPLTDLDLEFVFLHFSDPDLNRYLLDKEPVSTREQAQEAEVGAADGRKEWKIAGKG